MKRVKPLIKRLIPLLVVLAVIVAMLAAAPTLARFIRNTDEVKNDFTPVGSKNPTVASNWTIQVGETDYPVYVRAEIIITWQKDGNILFKKPIAGTDYQVTYGSDWTMIAGSADEKTYYYYTGTNADSSNGVVKSEGTTSAIITEFVDRATTPPYDGYELHVEVIVQTVQAVGYTDDGTLAACERAWGLASGALKKTESSDQP